MPLTKVSVNKGAKSVQNHCIHCIELFFSLLREGGISLREIFLILSSLNGASLCSPARTTLNDWDSRVYKTVQGSPSLTQDVFCNVLEPRQIYWAQELGPHLKVLGESGKLL